MTEGKGIEKFKDIGFKFDRNSLPSVNHENIWRSIQENQQRSMGLVNETQRKKAEYDHDILQTLKNIESNTTGLNEIVPLLSKNLEIQEEILNYLQEALSISTSRTEEEAVSKWRSLMSKATQITDDVETIQKLHGFANSILAIFQNLPG
jgi:predicted nuclease with TOPRIM domain